MKLIGAVCAEMPSASSDVSYGQQLPPVPAPRGPSPGPGFSQPPAGQPMMPGFPQPSPGDPSSNCYPAAVPRSQPPAAAAYGQPVPQVNLPQQPAGESLKHFNWLNTVGDKNFAIFIGMVP